MSIIVDYNLHCHSSLIWGLRLRVNVTSALTLAGWFSPIFGLATCWWYKDVIILLVIKKSLPTSKCCCNQKNFSSIFSSMTRSWLHSFRRTFRKTCNSKISTLSYWEISEIKEILSQSWFDTTHHTISIFHVTKYQFIVSFFVCFLNWVYEFVNWIYSKLHIYLHIVNHVKMTWKATE